MSYTSKPAQSISSLLSDCLDLMVEETPSSSVRSNAETKTENTSKPTPERTACSILLEERRQKREALARAQDDFIPLDKYKMTSNPLVQKMNANPLLSQVSQTPSFGAGGNTSSSTGANERLPDLSIYAGVKGKQTKKNLNKKNQKVHKKGEDYKDRMMEKFATKAHRKNRLQLLGKQY